MLYDCLWLCSWNSEASWRLLKLRPRYPGASHKNLKNLDTWALWILDSGFAQTSRHALIITPKDSVYANLKIVFDPTLVFDFALNTRAPCTIFSSFTHELLQAPIIRHLALAIDTWVPMAHYPSGEGNSAMLPLVRTKSAMVTRKIGKPVLPTSLY